MQPEFMWISSQLIKNKLGNLGQIPTFKTLWCSKIVFDDPANWNCSAALREVGPINRLESRITQALHSEIWIDSVGFSES